MKYTLHELAVIQQLAQDLAKSADRMAMMKIYSNDPSLHSGRLSDNLQAAFSELHSAMLGDDISEDLESAPEADLAPNTPTKARDLACFEQVAGVLGEAQAESELQQVIDSGVDVDIEEDMFKAFVWSESPQGHPYWRGVFKNA